MRRPLSHREQLLVATQGLPARHAAVQLRCSVHEVLELRARLRARGELPDFPHRQRPPAAGDQLTLDLP